MPHTVRHRRTTHSDKLFLAWTVANGVLTFFFPKCLLRVRSSTFGMAQTLKNRALSLSGTQKRMAPDLGHSLRHEPRLGARGHFDAIPDGFRWNGAREGLVGLSGSSSARFTCARDILEACDKCFSRRFVVRDRKRAIQLRIRPLLSRVPKYRSSAIPIKVEPRMSLCMLQSCRSLDKMNIFFYFSVFSIVVTILYKKGIFEHTSAIMGKVAVSGSFFRHTLSKIFVKISFLPMVNRLQRRDVKQINASISFIAVHILKIYTKFCFLPLIKRSSALPSSFFPSPHVLSSLGV